MPKPRKLWLALGIAALGLLAALGGYGLGRWLHAPKPQTTAAAPATAPDFTLPDLAGKPHRLADWRGKLVLLNFWATWCPPCRREIPVFIELQRRYAARGLEIVGVGVDDPAAVARYRQDAHINYTLLLANDSTYDLMTAYGNASNSLPYSALILPDGRVAATKLGAFERAELENLLERLLPPREPGSR